MHWYCKVRTLGFCRRLVCQMKCIQEQICFGTRRLKRRNDKFLWPCYATDIDKHTLVFHKCWNLLNKNFSNFNPFSDYNLPDDLFYLCNLAEAKGGSFISILLIFFKDRVLLCRLISPRTHYVDKASFKLTDI